MIKMHNLWLTAAVATTLTLSACGGGGDDTAAAVPDTTVPASAGASGAAFMSFIQGLNPADETSEPLTIGDNFAVPDDETNDASALS